MLFEMGISRYQSGSSLTMLPGHVRVTVITKCLVSAGNVGRFTLPRQAACHIWSRINSIGDWSALS